MLVKSERVCIIVVVHILQWFLNSVCCCIVYFLLSLSDDYFFLKVIIQITHNVNRNISHTIPQIFKCVECETPTWHYLKLK